MADASLDDARPGKAPWRTIYFRLEAPEARQVSVIGEFNDWNAEKHPLRKSPTGVWECQLPLPPGRYRYAFVVDGRRCPDPQCPRVETRAGEVRCIIEILPPAS